MRGKGRAGSSPRGLNTGSTSSSKYCSSHFSASGLQSSRPRRRMSRLASAGISTSLRQRYCSLTRPDARSWMAVACCSSDMPSEASGPEPSSSSCFSPETRISKNSSRLLEERHRLVECLGENAPVELEERELAVEVEAGRLEIGRVHPSSTAESAG